MGWCRTDHDRSFDCSVYCFFAICGAFRSRDHMGYDHACTFCRPHKARSHMNARSHTNIELRIRKPLHEHWTKRAATLLMLRCRKHSEGVFRKFGLSNSRIFGFRGLVSRKASNWTERNPHICFCLSGARARNSQSTCFVSRTTPAYLGRYTQAQRVCYQGLHLCSCSSFIVEAQSLVFFLPPKEEAKILPWDCIFVWLRLMSTRKPIRLPPRRMRFSMQSLGIAQPLATVSPGEPSSLSPAPFNVFGSPSFCRFSEVPKMRAPSLSPLLEN